MLRDTANCCASSRQEGNLLSGDRDSVAIAELTISQIWSRKPNGESSGSVRNVGVVEFAIQLFIKLGAWGPGKKYYLQSIICTVVRRLSPMFELSHSFNTSVTFLCLSNEHNTLNIKTKSILGELTNENHPFF